jgi:hypothetical protein
MKTTQRKTSQHPPLLQTWKEQTEKKERKKRKNKERERRDEGD